MLLASSGKWKAMVCGLMFSSNINVVIITQLSHDEANVPSYVLAILSEGQYTYLQTWSRKVKVNHHVKYLGQTRARSHRIIGGT